MSSSTPMSFSTKSSFRRTSDSSPAKNNSVQFASEVNIRVPSGSSGRALNTGDLWSVFSPHSEVELLPSEPETPLPARRDNSHSPEQRLALVAFRLAVLEKFATGLGKLAFVWATVVLLGGFVSDIQAKDFWIISGLLLTEGTRVFSRSSELEWQQANYSLGFLGLRSFVFDKSARIRQSLSASFEALGHGNSAAQPSLGSPLPTRKNDLYQGIGAKRTWSLGTLPFFPYIKFLHTRIISLILYALQIASAGVSIGFSLQRLIARDFIARDVKVTGNNTEQALTLFYALMLGEASLFLLERAYWEVKLRYQKLLEKVNKACELDPEDLQTMKLYWYAVYSRSLNGSVFDGLELDLIDFSVEKMQSSIREEQLGGVHVLASLVSKGVSREETRRRIGTTPGVAERLLEMMTWKDLSDSDIRKSATTVIKFLAHHRSNCFRISAVPGSIEGIASLLTVGDKQELEQEKKHGLTILNRLATDHRTCVRIGNTSGIVSVLVSFIHEDLRGLDAPKSRKIFKKSLELLRTLAAAGGESGRSLRKKIVSVVSTVRSLQQICEHEDYELQDLAVDVLKLLATEDEVRDSIGATGGVIEILLSILTKECPHERLATAMRAGEAIFLLVLQCPNNCSRLLKHKSYKKGGVSDNLKSLIGMLTKPDIGIHAATILRSLCPALNDDEKVALGSATREIVHLVVESTDKEQQAAIGLAAAVIPFLDEHSFSQAVISQRSLLCTKITELLSQNAPSQSLNRVRRYSIELLDCLIRRDAELLESFRKGGHIEACLENMSRTASDEENFLTFSGSVGITRHSSNLEELINRALSNLHSL